MQRLGDVQAPIEGIRSRSARPSTQPPFANGRPPARQRIVAGIVAFGVFVAAGAFGWQAFMGDGGTPSGPGVAENWPVATVTLESEGAQKTASLSIGGRLQQGAFGVSTSPDEEYPYQWSNPPYTVAWVDYQSLSGVACEGSGIGGV